MTSRDAILSAVAANRPAFDAPLPGLPAYDAIEPADRDALIQRFTMSLATMGGTCVMPAPGVAVLDTAQAALREIWTPHAVVVSNSAEIHGNRHLGENVAPESLHDVDIAVVRARFAVAETGSVAFTEAELIVNSVAYLAQHLVVLLDPAAIVGNLHRAYQRGEYASAAYTVFHSGPSATADIEGVLVRGAQGVRSLTVVFA